MNSANTDPRTNPRASNARILTWQLDDKFGDEAFATMDTDPSGAGIYAYLMGGEL